MKNKTLINVKLPATQKTYDFWVPDAMCIYDVAQLIGEGMETIEPDFFEKRESPALMYIHTGQIQNPNATISEIGFSDGDRFVLV